MVIALFVVMLASFNLAPRADLKTQQQEPLAEATITEFLVQHRAATKYAKEQFIKQSKGGTISLSSGGNSISICNASKQGNLCPYLPIGYKHNENQFYSKVYCLNENEYSDGDGKNRTRTKIAGTSPASCKNVGSSVRYVISYGRVPERWKNVSTNKILGDFFLALHNQVPAGASCGIIVPKQAASNYYTEKIKDSGDVEIVFDHNPLDSAYVIDGVDVYNASIPKYFLDNDSEFKSKCTLAVDGKYPCVIYITQM